MPGSSYAKVLIPGQGIKRLLRAGDEYKCWNAEEESRERLAEYSRWEAAKYRRLISTRSKRKAQFILDFEKVWERNIIYKEEYVKFFMELKSCVNFWASRFAYKWSNKWLCHADFESVFWEEAWKIAEQYDPECSDFYLYETLELCFKRKGQSIVNRATRTRQGAFEHSLERIPEGFEYRYSGRASVEGEVTRKILIDQMKNEPSFTERERALFAILYENLDASLRELAKLAGIKHQESVRRLLQNIRKKLEIYREDSLAYDPGDSYGLPYKSPIDKRRDMVKDEEDCHKDEQSEVKPEPVKPTGEVININGGSRSSKPKKKSTSKDLSRKKAVHRRTSLIESLAFPLQVVARKKVIKMKKPKKKKIKYWDDKGRYGPPAREYTKEEIEYTMSMF